MTDKELISWLRNLGPLDYELRHGRFQAATADRIEELLRENDQLRKENRALDWELNPDRVWGQFTEEEKNRSGWL